MNLESLVGQTLDEKYKIERELGRGGMGAVYLSTHVGTERPVAVKVIVPQFMQRAEFVERFRREARAAGRLRHPNVVDVTDFGFADTSDGRVAYLVMEYLDGCTLGEILEEEKQLPLEWTLDILEQVSSAIHEAHGQGIIHRDLKPDNIWLEPNQRGGYTVKVLDFGIAKLEATHGHENSDHEIDVSIPPNSAQQTQVFRQNPTVSDDHQSQTIPENRGATLQGDRQTITETSHSKTLFAEAGTLIQPAEAVDLESSTAILPASQTPTRKQTGEAGTKLISEQVETGKSALKKASTAELTRIGAVLGTPLYMSPEQCRGEKLTAQSDIYSLGVIAYQMLSGKTPFGGNFTDVMKAHKEYTPPPLVAKKVRKKVKRVVMSALAKDHANRPPTAESFASELRAASEGIGVLFQRALVIYTQHLPKFLLLSVLIYSPLALITFLQVVCGFLAASDSINKITTGIFIALLGLASMFFGILSGYLMFGTTTWLVTQIFAMPLRPVSLRPALKAVRKKWKSLLRTGLISGFLTFLGYVACFFPGIVLSILWALVAAVVMMENVRGLAALRRSKELVKRSLRTTTAAIIIMFLVPFMVSGLMAFLINRTVASFEPRETNAAVIRKENKSSTEQKPENQEANEDQININFGKKNSIAIDNTDEPKNMRKRVGAAVSEALTQILMLPITILVGSFSSIVVALLFLKTRQAGGESMQDLLAQFEEEDQPSSDWRKRVRNRLIQSGRITSKGDSTKNGKRTTGDK